MATKEMSYSALGRMVEEAMQANGGDREKAVKTVLNSEVASDRTTALKWWRSVGYSVIAEAHRHWHNRERPKQDGQPEQLQRDKNDGVDLSRQGFPAGRSGEWKTADEYTKADVQAQLECYRATVSGLKKRIGAGERLMSMMDEDEVVAETIEREGEEAEEAWKRFTNA